MSQISKRYGAFLIDLDGTLIGKTQQISSRVASAVKSLHPYLTVCISTGREPQDVLRFSKELELSGPQISDNGALILDPQTGNTIWSSTLQYETGKIVLSHLRERGHTFLATYPSGRYTDQDDIPTWVITRISALNMQMSDAEELIRRFKDDETLNVVKAFLPYNNLWAVDFTNTGINKGSATKRIGDFLRIQTSSIIAAGDSYNDLSMLKICGKRIVMEEAPIELKSIADYVAPSVDRDGLAIAIEEYVIPLVT